MAVEAPKVHLLGVQTAQRLTELVVGLEILSVDRVRDLGGTATVTRIVAEIICTIIAPTRIIIAAAGRTLQIPHFEIGVIHASTQLLEVLEVL